MKKIYLQEGIKLKKFCKNCGCNIGENEQFCPDCGKQTENSSAMKYCPNCGEKISSNENFCRNCSVKLNEVKNENKFDKYKIPLIIVTVIAAISIVAFGAYLSLDFDSYQDVKVDTISFSIPDDLEENEDMRISKNSDGIIYKSKFWQNDNDYLQIDVTYSTSNFNATEIAEDIGGEEESMFGYDGYYSEFEDTYSFTFVKGNKLISIYASNYDLLSEIETD